MNAVDKKFFASIILVAVLAAGFGFTPKKANATVPVVDDKAIGRLDKANDTLSNILSQEKDLRRYFYQEKPAAKSLASFLLQQLTQSVITWIQGGGNTNFVSNLEAALNDAADQAAGEFLNQLAGTNLCSPFNVNLKLTFHGPPLANRLSCSATDIFNNLQTSYQNFLSDFTNGGWIAYEATLTGSNNYIDALINTYDAKLLAESRRVATVQAKYQAGNGFLGANVKKEICDDFPEYENPVCHTVDIQTTPGNLVAEELNKAVGAGIDQAVNINDIGQAFNQIIAAVINRLIQSTQTGLASNSASTGIFDAGLSSGGPLPPPPPPPPPIPPQPPSPPPPPPPPPPLPLPDLVVSENPSVFSGAPQAGQVITFKGTIKNQGNDTATTTFQSSFQIDLNNDGTPDLTLSPSPTIANLAPDATQGVISGNWNAVQGTHRVILCADQPSPAIVESDKTNNCSPVGTGVFTISP